jgi:hypothetical protein
MRRILKLSVLCLAAGVVTACEPDQVIPTENIPTAGVRFLHAVPDGPAMDFRFVDIVESNAHFRITYRNSPVTTANVTASTTSQFKAARAGSRTYRIFYNDTIQSVASTLVVPEGTLTLEAGKNYTVLLRGYVTPGGAGRPAGAQPLTLTVLDETVPAPFDPATQVALRVINASVGAVDAFYYDASTGTQPGTSIAAGVAACCGAASVSNFAVAAPASYRFHVRPAGVTTFAIVDGLALAGAAAVTGPPGPFDAAPGTTVAGSSVTAIVYDPSISPAPTFSITTGATAVTTATTSPTTGYGRTTGSWRGDGFFVGQQITASGFTQAANNGASTITSIDTAATGTVASSTAAPGLSATATGYARSAASGSFLANGFQVGDIITATGFNTQNNGRSVVTGVTATTLTVTKAGGTVAQSAASGRSITADQRITVTKAGGTALEAGSTGPTTLLSATAGGYARSAGDFIADGFVVGQTISATGFVVPGNNGTSTITAITPTTLTVTKTVAPVPEAGSTGLGTFGTTTGSSGGFTRTVGSFITDGFQVGHSVTTSGFLDSSNNGTFTVTGVTATTLTVTPARTVAEAQAPGRTITTVDIRTIANGGNRTIAGVGGRVWSFIWDRRPPRPAGI